MLGTESTYPDDGNVLNGHIVVLMMSLEKLWRQWIAVEIS
jgi:hypothetical protein